MRFRSWRSRLLLWLLFVILVPASVHAGMVHVRSASLQQIVDDADLIVLARPADPATRTEEIDITPEGQAPDPAKYPTYHRVVSRYRVLEVLAPRAETPGRHQPLSPEEARTRMGRVIEVLPAHDRSNLDLHRRYYVDRISKSPSRRRYKPTQLTDGAGEPVILFLRAPDDDGRFSLVVGRAMEGAGAREEVTRLLSRDQASLKDEALGDFGLGTSERELRSKLGAPAKIRRDEHEEGATGCWMRTLRYPKRGLIFEICGDARRGDAGHVRSITARAPCALKTRAGFGVGDHVVKLRRAFPTAEAAGDDEPSDQWFVRDEESWRVLHVTARDAKITEILLDELPE